MEENSKAPQSVVWHRCTDEDDWCDDPDSVTLVQVKLIDGNWHTYTGYDCPYSWEDLVLGKALFTNISIIPQDSLM